MRLTIQLFAILNRKILTRPSIAPPLPKPFNKPSQTQRQTGLNRLTPAVPHQQFIRSKINTEYHGVKPNEISKDMKWILIYKFPHLIRLSIFCRFKLLLTAVSTSLCAYSLAAKLMPQIEPIDISYAIIFVTLGGLFLAGNIFRKVIVNIYASENQDYLRLARLTFFARRRDIVVPTSLCIPLSENNKDMTGLTTVLKFRRPTSIDIEFDTLEFYDEKFFVSLRYNLDRGIKDEELFTKIFGRIRGKNPVIQ